MPIKTGNRRHKDEFRIFILLIAILMSTSCSIASREVTILTMVDDYNPETSEFNGIPLVAEVTPLSDHPYEYEWTTNNGVFEQMGIIDEKVITGTNQIVWCPSQKCECNANGNSNRSSNGHDCCRKVSVRVLDRKGRVLATDYLIFNENGNMSITPMEEKQ